MSDSAKITSTPVAFYQKIHCKHPDDAKIADNIVPIAQLLSERVELRSRNVVFESPWREESKVWNALVASAQQISQHGRYDRLTWRSKRKL